jgi:hypothetical protein
MWTVERIVHFEPGDFLVDGVSHFGFRDLQGRLHAVDHAGHVVARVGADGKIGWTVAAAAPFAGVPNVKAELEFPMYVDVLPDETVLISNFECARLYRVDPTRLWAELLVDGKALGLVDMGNCVVDGDGFVWVNEVRGCRVWRFDPAGRPVLTLGDGIAGFQPGPVAFERVRFGWIYDLRLGPDRMIYVLDSGNFAVRALDPATRVANTVAGVGRPGYDGDGGDARAATFGGEPDARFNGPISLALDELGNVFVGDRYNGVVRMIEHAGGTITTIAGDRSMDDQAANDPRERDPRRLRLPQISSMDYSRGRLYVPTDLPGGAGDLAVLRRL